jgi:NADH dehydrogenase
MKGKETNPSLKGFWINQRQKSNFTPAMNELHPTPVVGKWLSDATNAGPTGKTLPMAGDGVGRKHVVIVGGGFAGLYTAKSLKGKNVRVTLIDKKNHHTFQPLLYQVATTVLSPGQIATPLRRILCRCDNTEVIMDEVVGFDLDRKLVSIKIGEDIPYDFLVLAAGARHSYFGHDEWSHFAPGLKTVEDALDIRRRILLAFELAEREAFLEGEHGQLNFAIIGGGPTGVELAGAVADIARRAVAKDYKTIDTRKARVMLIEGSPRVLAAYPEELSKKAHEQLTSLGVEVHTGIHVTDVELHRIKMGDEWIPVRAALWATGVAASPLGKLLGVAVDRAGRVSVGTDMTLPGRPEVMVIGDMSSMKDGEGKAVPGLGAAAQQQGKQVAINIVRAIEGQPLQPFIYKDKGSMATIGRNRAVAQFGKMRLSGFPAWAMWAFVHVYLLIGFRNRISVMREWTWAYFTGERSATLITGNIDDIC